MADDTKFLEKHGYLQGTYENRLSQLGINPDKKVSGKNVNPNEFASYINKYQTNLTENPSSAIAGYGNVDKSYEEAKKLYLDMLPSLEVRYSDMLNQLSSEQAVTQQRNAIVSQQEGTALKNEIAKRGLAVSTGDTFYSGQANKLQENQGLRATETDLGFSRERLATTAERDNTEMAIKSGVAGLTTEQATTLADMITNEKNRIAQVLDGAIGDKQFAYSANYQAKRDEIADELANEMFQYTKDQDAKQLALDQAKLALSGSKNKDSEYAKDMFTTVLGIKTSGQTMEYTREGVEAMMTEAYPDKAEQIKKDIKKYFPDGWESQVKSSLPSETKKVMDELGVDEETATMLLRQQAGL